MDYKTFMAQLAKRNEEMRRLRAKGWNLDRLAARFAITKQRVSQICNGSTAQ